MKANQVLSTRQGPYLDLGIWKYRVDTNEVARVLATQTLQCPVPTAQSQRQYEEYSTIHASGTWIVELE